MNIPVTHTVSTVWDKENKIKRTFVKSTVMLTSTTEIDESVNYTHDEKQGFIKRAEDFNTELLDNAIFENVREALHSFLSKYNPHDSECTFTVFEKISNIIKLAQIEVTNNELGIRSTEAKAYQKHGK